MKTSTNINYFDLGLWKTSLEIDLMLDRVLPKFNNIDCNIYGFEAHPGYCESLKRKYIGRNNVNIINLAISDKKGIAKLYLATNEGLGNSIFSTKNNVVQNNSLEVKCDLFSNWLNENNIDLDNSINILKINIEGAELFLFEDIKNNNLRDKFDIVCGHNMCDILKVKELTEKVEYYNSLVKELDINPVYFCHANINKSINEMVLSLNKLLNKQ